MAKSLNLSANLKLQNSRLSEAGTDFVEELEGSILLDILDEDAMVIIGEKLFYLDFDNRIVAVSSDYGLREEMLQKDYSNPSIALYGFEEDVLGLVEINESSEFPISNERIQFNVFDPNAPTITDGCVWNNCNNNGHWQQNLEDPASGYVYRLEAKHVYQAAGIFFRLLSEAKHMKKHDTPLFSPEHTNITIYYNYWYESKKSSIGIRSGQSVATLFARDLNPIFYQSSRGLERFRLDSQFQVFVGGDHGPGTLGWWIFNLERISKGNYL